MIALLCLTPELSRAATRCLGINEELDGALDCRPFPGIPHDQCSKYSFNSREELVEIPARGVCEQSHYQSEEGPEDDVENSVGAGGQCD